MTVTTAPDPRWQAPVAQAAPAILYHRWLRYDGTDWKTTKDTRLPFLREVGSRIDAVARSAGYRAWHERQGQAFGALGAESLEAPTLWRLVTGTATNPALESGLQLHPLWGVPYLPGSSVKGLLHHFAERWAVERAEAVAGVELSAGVTPPVEAVRKLVGACREVRQVFGSLGVERGSWEPEPGRSVPVGAETPRSLLHGWLRHDLLPSELAEEELAAIRNGLLGAFTSGRLAVYDALPLPGQDLVEADILNPHYPEYYRTGGAERLGDGTFREVPPSDDQNPEPVYFLAVRAGVRFEFRWRLCPRESREEEVLDDAAMLDRVRGWMGAALGTWGAGAKTAAGYGYFMTPATTAADDGSVASPEGESGTEPTLETPPGADPVEREVWPAAIVRWIAESGSLEAASERGKAQGKAAVLARLPQDLQDRLTGGPKVPGEKRPRRKVLRLDVEVLVLGTSYFEISGFPGAGDD